jgi:hypothetical protein
MMEVVSQQRDNVFGSLADMSGCVKKRPLYPKSRHSRRRSAMSVIANSGLLKLPQADYAWVVLAPKPRTAHSVRLPENH